MRVKQKLELVPEGWPCSLSLCPPGFFVHGEMVGFKSEYVTGKNCDAYCDSGEYFWGGTKTKEDRDRVIVQPLVYRWQLGGE